MLNNNPSNLRSQLDVRYDLGVPVVASSDRFRDLDGCSHITTQRLYKLLSQLLLQPIL